MNWLIYQIYRLMLLVAHKCFDIASKSSPARRPLLLLIVLDGFHEIFRWMRVKHWWEKHRGTPMRLMLCSSLFWQESRLMDDRNLDIFEKFVDKWGSKRLLFDIRVRILMQCWMMRSIEMCNQLKKLINFRNFDFFKLSVRSLDYSNGLQSFIYLMIFQW